MSKKTENFVCSFSIRPLDDNTKPEFVSVLVVRDPSSDSFDDGDALQVTFPSNEHLDFTSIQECNQEYKYDPKTLIQDIANRDWKNDPDVPYMIRWFMIQQDEFIETIDNDNWLLEIDTESSPGHIIVGMRAGNQSEKQT